MALREVGVPAERHPWRAVRVQGAGDSWARAETLSEVRPGSLEGVAKSLPRMTWTDVEEGQLLGRKETPMGPCVLNWERPEHCLAFPWWALPSVALCLALHAVVSAHTPGLGQHRRSLARPVLKEASGSRAPPRALSDACSCASCCCWRIQIRVHGLSVSFRLHLSVNSN